MGLHRPTSSARTHLVHHLSPTSSSSAESPTPINAPMAHLPSRRWAPARHGRASARLTNLAGHPSSIRILEAYRAPLIRWLRPRRRDLLGLFLVTTGSRTSFRVSDVGQAVVGQAQSAPCPARTAMPPPSIVAYLLQTPISPMGSEDSSRKRARIPFIEALGLS